MCHTGLQNRDLSWGGTSSFQMNTLSCSQGLPVVTLTVTIPSNNYDMMINRVPCSDLKDFQYESLLILLPLGTTVCSYPNHTMESDKWFQCSHTSGKDVSRAGKRKEKKRLNDLSPGEKRFKKQNKKTMQVFIHLSNIKCLLQRKCLYMW